MLRRKEPWGFCNTKMSVNRTLVNRYPMHTLFFAFRSRGHSSRLLCVETRHWERECGFQWLGLKCECGCRVRGGSRNRRWCGSGSGDGGSAKVPRRWCGLRHGGSRNPKPCGTTKEGQLGHWLLFLLCGAGPAGGPAPSRENKEDAWVLVVEKGFSPGMLMAGASVGAVIEADIEGAARPRPNEGGSASVDEGAVIVVAVAGEGRRLPHSPCGGFGASALGAAGGANNGVAVGVTVGGLVGSGIVTVITGRLVGTAASVNPSLPELAPAGFELVTRALSLSSTLASASRFSIMLSICRPDMPLAPAGRAHDARPFCIPDQLGIPPPGVVVICRTVITVPPFRAGVLMPPPLESETAVWRPGVVGLVVVDGGSRRESRFDRPGVVGIEPMMGLGLVGRLELDTPRILPLFHISALPGESPPDPGSFGEHEGNGNLFSFPVAARLHAQSRSYLIFDC
jgi:hypothetical protein